MEQEIWVPVSGYSGKYEVSSLGRVKSLDRVVIDYRCGKKTNRFHHGRIATPQRKPNGYLFVRFGTEQKQFYLHRVVFLSFNNLPLLFLGYHSRNIVMHIDDNPKNCRLDNLKIGTTRDNLMDKIGKNRANLRKKLSESDVLEIRNLNGKMLQREIAKIYNVSSSYICQLLSKQRRMNIMQQ